MMRNAAGGAIEGHQPAATALGRWVLRDQFVGQREIEIGNVHETASAPLVVTPPEAVDDVRYPGVAHSAVPPDDVVVDAPDEIVALVVAPYDVVVFEVPPDDIVVVAPDDVVFVPPDDVIGDGVVRPHDVVVPAEQVKLRVAGAHEAIAVDDALAPRNALAVGVEVRGGDAVPDPVLAEPHVRIDRVGE